MFVQRTKITNLWVLVEQQKVNYSILYSYFLYQTLNMRSWTLNSVYNVYIKNTFFNTVSIKEHMSVFLNARDVVVSIEDDTWNIDKHAFTAKMTDICFGETLLPDDFHRTL